MSVTFFAPCCNRYTLRHLAQGKGIRANAAFPVQLSLPAAHRAESGAEFQCAQRAVH